MSARRRLLPVLALAALLVTLTPGAASAAPASALPGTLRMQMVPPMRGVLVSVDGNSGRTDAHGRLDLRVRNFTGLDERLRVAPTAVAADRKVIFDRTRGSADHGVRGRMVEIGLRTVRRVSWSYLDRFDTPVPADRVTAMRLRSNTGEIVELTGADLSRPLWLAESRTQQGPRGLASKRLYYVVDTVMVDGTSVVNRAGQKFVPWERQRWMIRLLFFKVTFSASDMVFTRRAGHGIELTRADGRVQRLPFADDGSALVPDLPRGTYTVSVLGGGLSFGRPVSISRDQQVDLDVISPLDLVLVGVAVFGLACGLVVAGRPALRRRLAARRLGHLARRLVRGRRTSRPQHAALCLVAAMLALTGTPSARARADAGPAPSAAAPVPLFAFYYIWFNPTSWHRAKTDYPLLGRYSSDDTEIMRRHVRMAKAAGIDGFLVSWKHTPQLDGRLAKLVEVAREQDFRLGIVYQGIDFARKPLPLATVSRDLDLFASRYADDPVFAVFDRPLVVWNGSDRFSTAQVGTATAPARRRLLVLGTAKSVAAAQRFGAVLDGQAYYWSSADPLRDQVREKLTAMAQAVHQRGGLWIAPVAPGYDARAIGGRRVIERRDGATLRASFAAAREAQPDALGVISWNEFTENTYVEPSEQLGGTYLETLAELRGVSFDYDPRTDSGQPHDRPWGLPAWAALAGTACVALGMPLVFALRRRRPRPSGGPPTQRARRSPAEGAAGE
ncbi:hypothetical protein K7640_01165 [Micromonospora sp. PLK6-60]|uniref:endo-1,3-alpha-glucanase family glycosylhydrolase n=1 Tax=Micromonospora sp. PLK6-60 TaxID=2873383 RepID=UPI001CA74FED|nr:endo-1,3-alpha-glucanase family glycosylhydrolase [Micromonospora sp. PLK6-60]MBY8870450.1 hypothetical protein [Micromonospora sp. PLK6-60]